MNQKRCLGEEYELIRCSQVEPQEKKKTPKGRAKKRITYTRRFVNVTMTGGKRKVRSIRLYGGLRHKIMLDVGLTNIIDEPESDNLMSYRRCEGLGDCHRSARSSEQIWKCDRTKVIFSIEGSKVLAQVGSGKVGISLRNALYIPRGAYYRVQQRFDQAT